jgi:3-methyladenine DNA glycosylase Tag
MSTAYIPTKQELREAISKEVRDTVLDVLPAAIREAKQKEWLDTADVMDMLQCSRRHVQHLRDSEQIIYHQTGRTIRYKYQDITAYLNEGKVAAGGAK